MTEYDEENGILFIRGTSQCDIGDLMASLGHCGPNITPFPKLYTLYISGTAVVTLNHTHFLELCPFFRITLMGSASLTINISPEFIFKRIHLNMSGTSQCIIHNSVQRAMIYISGKCHCNFMRAIDEYSVERLTSVSTLMVGGYRVPAAVRREFDESSSEARIKIVAAKKKAKTPKAVPLKKARSKKIK